MLELGSLFLKSINLLGFVALGKLFNYLKLIFFTSNKISGLTNLLWELNVASCELC